MPTATYALDSTWRPLLKDLGVSPSDVLREAALPHDLLSRPSVRLSAEMFHRFWRGLEAAYANPLLPVHLCRLVRSETFSPVIFASLSCDNLLVAAQRVARYKALVGPMHLEIEEASDTVSIRLGWPSDDPLPPPSFVVTELLFMVTLARIGTREVVRPSAVVTPAPIEPTVAAHCAEYLGTAIRCGARHEVRFRRQDALLPFLTVNEGLWSTFEPQFRTRLAELDQPGPLRARVRAVLRRTLAGSAADIETVANRLAMSPRSLQRQLATEGTTFRHIVQETRLALARHYLRATPIPMAEIAFLLGFREPTSFHRAFRLWTGDTPDNERRAHSSASGEGPKDKRRDDQHWSSRRSTRVTPRGISRGTQPDR